MNRRDRQAFWEAFEIGVEESTLTTAQKMRARFKAKWSRKFRKSVEESFQTDRPGEIDWDKLREFLEWLIPFLIELFGGDEN